MFRLDILDTAVLTPDTAVERDTERQTDMSAWRRALQPEAIMGRPDNTEQTVHQLPAWEHLSTLPANELFDWVSMAKRFDEFVMDPANGVRFTDDQGNVGFTAFLEGKNTAEAFHELVSFGPIVLGKALLGHDVTDLIGSLSGFYNQEHAVFLNGRGRARLEMWYLMYVTSLAAHLVRRVCPADPVFREQIENSFRTLAGLAERSGHDFNHQGYDFTAEEPFTRKDIYRQPDAIGGYAYLMLMAYELTAESVYLEEAEESIDRYLEFDKNPWYEVPDCAMAVLACARLASLGRPRDTLKALGFLLDPDGGLAVGKWGDKDVTGLYRGWRHSTPESVYSLESFMALPYILAAARHQPEIAPVIGAYALHVSANARHFYSEFIKDTESRADLTPVVAYERLYQEYEGKHAYAAGDFAGHKSIYGGGYALWWAALTAPCDDPGMLRLDLSSADFMVPCGFPTWLFYNPHDTPRKVTVEIDENDLYDLNEHRDLAAGSDYQIAAVKAAGDSAVGDGGRSGPSNGVMEVLAGSARVVAVVPRGKRSTDGNLLSIDGIAVDFDVSGLRSTMGT